MDANHIRYSKRCSILAFLGMLQFRISMQKPFHRRSLDMIINLGKSDVVLFPIKVLLRVGLESKRETLDALNADHHTFAGVLKWEPIL